MGFLVYAPKHYLFFQCVHIRLKFEDKIHIPSTITIIPKNISMLVRSTIINGWVILGAYFQMVFRTDLAQGLQFFTHHLLFGPDFTVQPSPVLWYKVGSHKCQQKVFHYFLMLCSKGLRTYYFSHILDSRSKFGYVMQYDPTYLVLKSKASCLPNLESALIWSSKNLSVVRFPCHQTWWLAGGGCTPTTGESAQMLPEYPRVMTQGNISLVPRPSFYFSF